MTALPQCFVVLYLSQMKLFAVFLADSANPTGIECFGFGIVVLTAHITLMKPFSRHQLMRDFAGDHSAYGTHSVTVFTLGGFVF